MDITSPQVWIGWTITGLAAYLGVYLAEKAKRRAAHEDSDQIRDELARTTQAVKEIEAKISGDIWTRQARWNQKRDLYFQLIKDLTAAIDAYNFAFDIDLKTGEELVPNLHDYHSRLDCTFRLAAIFTDENCFKMWRQYLNERNIPSRPNREWAQREVFDLSRLRVQVTALANEDLKQP